MTTNDLRFVSWNVNGLRALEKKPTGFSDVADALMPDVIALQETKLQPGQLKLDLPGYRYMWSYCVDGVHKGYSGTAVISREEPLREVRRIGCAGPVDLEGRVCALEFERYWFVNVYTPNSKNGLTRLGERMAWDDAFRAFMRGLAAEKPVVACGDFNVAHADIDVARPNPKKAGCSPQERMDFTHLLGDGFTDTFRALHPDEEGAYSWWDYRTGGRARNVGMRLDYFLVSDDVADRVVESAILKEVYGSDHCPIELKISL